MITEHPEQLRTLLGEAASDPLKFAGLTTALHRRSMVRMGPNSLLLHESRRRYCVPPRRQEKGGWAATAVLLLATALPGDVWSNPLVWPTWRQLLPHVLAATDSTRHLNPVLTEVSWLLDRAATYMQTRGEPRAAQPIFQRVFTLRLDTLGEDHPDTLGSATNLALDLWQLG